MKANFIKGALGISLMLFPFLAFSQLPFSPCSPSGGKRADVLGVETKYRAPGGVAPTFTIPAGTKSIVVFTSSETGITAGGENPAGDEDFITINAIIDIASATSSGYVNYAKNTNTDGSGTNVYGWRNVALGAFIPAGSKVGDATPANLNNVNFSISGSTLTITESTTSTHTSYYVEYLSPNSNSLNPLDPQVRALLHGTGAANTDLTVPVPTGTDLIIISAKGTNSSSTDLVSASGTEEGYSNLRFTLDLTAGLTDGFVTLANGGTVDRRSTYVINDLSTTATNNMLSSGVITGDYSAKLTTAGAVGIYNPQIYVSGSNLIIKRDANYARDFDDAYVIEFYDRVGLGMSAEFIGSDISDIARGVSSSTGVSRTFKIPSGTNFIYFNETGNAVNSNNESNENSLAAYAYIDLASETATGYFYQQVGLSSTTRRDDNYAFKGVPLNNTSTRSHANTVGYKTTPAPPLTPYDISFSLSADKSELTVINKTGLANPDYQFLLSADFYGSRPDIAFNTSGISFAKGASCKIVKATMNVCNPGSGNNNGGMPVAFYAGNPTTDPAAKLLYTSTFNEAIAMGDCKSFSFDIDLSSFSDLNIDLTIIINDNGSFVPGGVGNAVGTPFTLASLANQNPLYKECYYDNNLISQTINVNNCPVADLDPDKSSGSAGAYSYQNNFTAGSTTGAKIADADLAVIDPDGGNLQSATITLTNVLDTGNESLILNGTLPAGITISGAGTSVITLSGTASMADYIAAIRMIEYMNTNGTPNTTIRTITTVLNDGTENGPASTTSITILTNPHIDVMGNSVSIADGTTTTNVPDGTDYGANTGSGSAVPHTFSVKNIGTGTVNITSVSVSGDPGFSITTPVSSTALASGNSTDFVVTFNPSAHTVGIYTATITIVNDDPDAGRSSYTFVVSAIVNNLPVVSNSTVNGTEDNTLNFTAANFTANYTDADGTALDKIRILSLPADGSFMLSGVAINTGDEIPAASLGNISFIPAANWNGTTSFSWTGSDGTSYATTPATMTINIQPVNDIPTGTGDTKTTRENTPVSGMVTGADADGDALTFSPGTGPLHGSAGINPDGSYTYVPLAGYSGPDSFTILIEDGNGGSVTVPVTITVVANQAPTGTGDTKTTNEDTPVTGTVSGTDPDGDVLTFLKASEPAHGTVIVYASGSYAYTPDADYNGPDNFNIEINDGNGGTVTVTVNITVAPVNDVPTGTGDNRSTGKNTPVSGAVTGNDKDGDPLTFSKGTDPLHGTVTVNPDGTYTYTPANGYTGTDNFTINISDGNGGSTTVSVSINVNATNSTPVGTGDSKTTNQDTPVNGVVTATDADGDLLTFTKGTDPANGTVTVNPDGTYTYTPAAGYTGTDSFTITISDSNGATTTVTVYITVNTVTTPVAPVATDDREDTKTNTPVVVRVLDNDNANGSALDAGSVEIVTQPDHGTVVVNEDGTITYTPANGYNGADLFTYRVKDAAGTYSNAASVTINTSFVSVTVPNLFTPNGDGKNDVFEIRGLNQYYENELTIVNRWGNEVYRQRGYQNTWNGHGLNEGTYFYLLRIRRSANAEWEVVKGYITLVRAFKK
ncbi:Ig-like domain-containing protein [Chitinophaga tropicalis]|uniref:Tandem-95 repeat protein n=1 Tax=Chitinophaga tropicalis TaxID=2683588 RepID=A0A7K1U269_9BACT|nr:Ig-like domain-containing protein [Chitinophaga tropicalis]MVT08451.1 tandem-95 repeat protein [Chitinophaga tropicalis]